MSDYVVLDLETQRTIDEVGGRRNISRLGLAAAVTYTSSEDSYRRYKEEQAADLIAELSAASLVVGFNLLEFDYVVLGAYADTSLSSLPTVDMLDRLHRTLGFRVSLDNLASHTLGSSKSGDGFQAVRWFREGQLDRVFEYCQQDVELTNRLYLFGKQHRHVRFRDSRRGQRKVNVDW